jgi:hypothetical protein
VDESAYHGHGPTFRDKANEISARLGLGRVRTNKKRGKDEHLPSCSHWPHNVRDAKAYYLGAYVPDCTGTGVGLCRILQMDFREFLFHALG